MVVYRRCRPRRASRAPEGTTLPKVIGYHRPATVDEALSLLLAPGETERILLGGGTVVNAERAGRPVEVIDLQAAGLGGIDSEGAVVTIGATTTLQELADDPRVPPLLADLAGREVVSTLRTLATVGGLVAGADPESELLAGFLAYGARVHVAAGGAGVERDLDAVLRDGVAGEVITALSLEATGTAAAARTGRTPGDVPIVAVVGHKAQGGAVRIAASGVSDRPTLVLDPDALRPPSDFRGSSGYRRALAAVLLSRVEAELS